MTTKSPDMTLSNIFLRLPKRITKAIVIAIKIMILKRSGNLFQKELLEKFANASTLVNLLMDARPFLREKKYETFNIKF